MNNFDPTYSYLVEMEKADFDKDYTIGTFGKIYGKYLIDLNKNQDLWAKTYKALKAIQGDTGKALELEY